MNEEEVAPTDFPQTTPPMAQPGHDFTLQCIMELQKTVATLVTKVDRLVEDQGKATAEISTISKRIAYFLGGATVAGAILGVAITFAVRLPWERILPAATPAPAATAQSPVAPTP